MTERTAAEVFVELADTLIDDFDVVDFLHQVTIRCAEVQSGSKSGSLRLFAGAGIVMGSTPEQELAETATKFRTMLNAMGIQHALEALP